MTENGWKDVVTEHNQVGICREAVSPQHLVLDAVDLLVLNVEGADEHVVGDVVQVAAVLEPGAGHGDVVSRALALHLDQHQGVLQQRHMSCHQRRDTYIGPDISVPVCMLDALPRAAETDQRCVPRHPCRPMP